MKVSEPMKKILIINGPNLNLLGDREQNIYGTKSLKEIINYTNSKVPECNLEWFQSNIEGEIVTRIQEAKDENILGLIINPAAYSHTSIAILDALLLLKSEIIEVHLSQIYQREEFRHIMLTGRAASKIMSGFGYKTYHYAVLSMIEKKDEE